MKKQGYSLVEVMISMLISVIVMEGVMSVTMIGNKNVVINQQKLSLVSSQSYFEKIWSRYIAAIFPQQFDPSQSYSYQNSNFVGLGTAWNFVDLRGQSVPWLASDIRKLNIGGLSLAQSSHFIELSRTVLSASLGISKNSKGALLSRCLQMLEPDALNALLADPAQILNLPKPLIKDGSVQCCDSSGCNSDLSFFPSTFVFWFNTDGSVQQIERIPADQDRSIIPGMSFVISFDKNPPQSYTFHSILLKNECKLKLKRPDCATTNWGSLDFTHYNEDLKYYLSSKTYNISNDIQGSSFVKIGTFMEEKN